MLGGLGNNDDLQSDYDASTMDQRQRLLSGTERLAQSSRRLEDSHRLALETEGIGINILSTLKGQRETLIRARDTVSDDSLDHALLLTSKNSLQKLIHILIKLQEP